MRFGLRVGVSHAVVMVKVEVSTMGLHASTRIPTSIEVQAKHKCVHVATCVDKNKVSIRSTIVLSILA